jgi:hypothetical protein
MIMFNVLKSSKKFAFFAIMLLIVLMSSVNGQVTFKHVTLEIGNEFQIYPNCEAWGDIDNDGDLDVYMAVGSKMGFDLMLNDLNVSGKFLKADTLMAHFVKTAGPRQVLMADMENDGDLDLLAVADEEQTYIIINKLIETDSLWFEDVSHQIGMAYSEELYYCASMADYNNDGLLDLFMGGLSGDFWTPTLLLKNTSPINGPLSFEDATDQAGILSTPGLSISTGSWGDYDNDGDPDLITATYPTYPVFLYRNESDGTFTDVTTETGLINSVGSSRATAWIDYDNDGDFDVYVARATYTEQPDMDICQLWRNDDGIFHEVESARVVHRTIRGMAWGDYDNDGDLDVHLSEEGKDDILFRNDGNDTFVDVAASIGLTQVEDPNGWGMLDIADRGGQTWADWDADGDLDLLLAGMSATQPYLMQNDGGNTNNWLEIKLAGVQSNIQGVGARIITLSGNLRQMREVTVGGGYLCGPPADVHFGFGQRTVIDSLIIRWPYGTLDVFVNVDVNQLLTIEEGSGSTGVVSNKNTTPENFELFQNYPNPFNPKTQISYNIAKPGLVNLEIFNTLGEKVSSVVREYQSAGNHKSEFDAGQLPTGVYVYRLSSGTFMQQKKMLLIK